MENTPMQMLQALRETTVRLLADGIDQLKALDSCIQATNNQIAALQEYIDSHPFADNAAEIDFFKNIRPVFDGMRLFFIVRLHLELRLLEAGPQAKTILYQQVLQKQHVFYQHNSIFYKYHYKGSTHLDQFYYLRNAPGLYLDPEEDGPIFCDRKYFAPMSYKAARIAAYKFLHDYILSQIALITSPGKQAPGDRLKWTATKAALGELLYALQEYAAFNGKKIEIKKIADYFQAVFDVDLGNIYKIYEDIRLRKKSRTPFLDALRNSLLRRLDLDDENAL